MSRASPLQTATTSGASTARERRASVLLPHECFFGAFLLLQWLRLVWTVGPTDAHALLYLGLLLANVAVITWCENGETTLRWQLRLWFYPVVMNLVFFTMGPAIMKVAPGRYDLALKAIDEHLFGAVLSVHAQALASPLLTEVMSLCYLLMFPYLLISWIVCARRELPVFRQLIIGLFTIYGLGFLGYSLVPAAGPHLAFPEQFSAPLPGWAITNFNARVVATGSNGVDVFPSLHCAVTAFLICFDRRHAPWRFRILCLPCAGLWLATVYLRYHYFIDVVCGFALAAFGCWIANRWAETSPRAKSVSTLP